MEAKITAHKTIEIYTAKHNEELKIAEELFIEEILGLKNEGDTILLVRKNASGLSCLAYLESRPVDDNNITMEILAGKKINIVELQHLLEKIKRVKIKDNLKEILTTIFPDEYNDSDFIFFNKYAGKEANIYQWAGGWWILEDDNYLITPDCFDELG